MPRILALIVLASVSLACASTGPIVHPPWDRSVTVNAPFDEVWDALIRLASDSGWPITTLEKDSGLLSIEDASVGADWRFDCPTQFTTVMTDVRVRMSFVVRDIGDTTEVTANIRARGFEESIFTDNTFGWSNCESLGYAERAIQDSIRLAVGDPAIQADFEKTDEQ